MEFELNVKSLAVALRSEMRSLLPTAPIAPPATPRPNSKPVPESIVIVLVVPPRLKVRLPTVSL